MMIKGPKFTLAQTFCKWVFVQWVESATKLDLRNGCYYANGLILLYTLSMDIIGFVPFCMNMLDASVRGWKYTK